MTTEWHEQRRAGIGGSDVAALLGLSKWKSPYQLFLEKTGNAPPQEDNEAMYWGRMLEPVIRDAYEEKTGTAKLNKCAADRRMLARKITTRKEDRQVECDWEFDYPKGKAYLIRLDTGVTIDSRPLTDDERQQRLDLEGEENPYPDHESSHHQQGPVIDGEILQIEQKPELAEEQRRDGLCNEWRGCDYADECMEQPEDAESVCLKSEASKHQPEAAEDNQED